MTFIDIPIGLNMLQDITNEKLGEDVFSLEDVLTPLTDIIKLVKIRNHYVNGDDVPEVSIECLCDLAADAVEYMYSNTIEPCTNKAYDDMYAKATHLLTMSFTELLGRFDNMTITNVLTIKRQGDRLVIMEGE